VNPGELWDREAPSPLLLQYIRTPGIIPDGRALVPGCGRGYDVAALCSDRREVIGLDLSQKAVDAANEYLSTLSGEVFPHRSHGKVECRSFFDLKPDINPQEDSFDFVYDYTFLCALDPSIRGDWANKMAEIIKPGGILLTLIFPIWTIEKHGGPPFQVSLKLFEDLLLARGFECLELRMLEKELCHADRDGGPEGKGPFTGVGRWRKL
jgi:hypothetical protein